MINVLLVEDSYADARLAHIALTETMDVEFNVIHANRLSQALQLLATQTFDAILLDLSLPDSHGLNTVKQVCAANHGVPIIVLSGLSNEEQALEAVKSGAQDYLVKGQGDHYLLPRTIQYAIERQKAEHALKQANDNLERNVETRTAELATANSELRKEIAERKRAENALRESEESLRAVFEQAAVGVAVIESNSGKFLRINLKYCDIVGYTSEEMLSLDFMKITHPEDLRSDLDKMQQMMNGEIHEFLLEKRYIRKNGSVVWVNLTVSPLRNTSKEVYSHIAVVEDITQRKQAEEALRASEAQLRLITDNLPVLIAYVDSEHRYRFNNKAYHDWFNLPHVDLVGRQVCSIVGGALYKEILPYIKLALSGQSVNFETSVPSKNDSARYFNFSYIPDKDNQGVVKGFFALIKDISERKSAEEQEKQLMLELAHGARLSDMGKMATEISHELNQPLTAITNYGNACINLLESGQSTQEDLLKGLNAIVEQAMRSGDVIRNIREFVRKTDVQRMPLSINELVRAVSSLVNSEARRNQVDIKLTLADCLPPVVVNKILIEQVILNLMRNAIEAMSEIEDTQHLRILSVQTKLNEDEQLEIITQDTGPGFTERDINKVFESFFTTKENGMGIGLSICRSIIEDHEGKIWVESNKPQGAIFRFTLPGAIAA